MPDTLNFTGIHPEAAARIKPLFEEVLAAKKERVHSLHVIGSAVTDAYLPGKSDVNSVCVLTSMDFSFLARLAPLGKSFGKKGVKAPIIMTPGYIEDSLDVFPIEFRNIAQIHRTVHGPDLFAGLCVGQADLRQQCERDLKAKLIGLRQGYLAMQGDAKTLSSEFASAISGYAPLFRAIVQLFGQEPPVNMETLIAKLGETTGVETSVYLRVWQMKKSGSKTQPDELIRLFESFYRTTEDLSLVIDAFHA